MRDRNSKRVSVVKLFATLAFSVAYIASYLSTAPSGDPQLSLLLMGLVFCGLSGFTFLYAGSHRILLIAAFSFGHLLFIGGAAVLLGVGAFPLRTGIDESLVLVFLTIFFIYQLLMLLLSDHPTTGDSLVGDVGVGYLFISFGFAMVAILATFVVSDPEASSLLQQFWLIAIILATLVASSMRISAQSVFYFLIVAVIVVGYLIFGFSGFGRLIMATYLLSSVVVISWTKRSYIPKLALLVFTGPALAALTYNRIQFAKSEQGRDIEALEGIASVFAPFQSGVQVFQAFLNNTIAPTGGESHLTSLVFWIPRAWWTGKPVGFGRAIVPYTHPEQMANTGFSDAAPYLAELVWDFGWIGIALGFVMIMLVACIERWLQKVASSDRWQLDTPSAVYTFSAAVVFVVLILNYVWGGSFLYLGRGLFPFLFLLGLAWILRTVTFKRQRVSSGRFQGTQDTVDLASSVSVSRHDTRN